jgi:hypothetical protein
MQSCVTGVTDMVFPSGHNQPQQYLFGDLSCVGNNVYLSAQQRLSILKQSSIGYTGHASGLVRTFSAGQIAGLAAIAEGINDARAYTPSASCRALNWPACFLLLFLEQIEHSR